MEDKYGVFGNGFTKRVLEYASEYLLNRIDRLHRRRFKIKYNIVSDERGHLEDLTEMQRYYEEELKRVSKLLYKDDCCYDE